MKPAIILEQVQKCFPMTFSAQSVAALESVSFTVAEGSFTIVGGANGSGKSVLMQLIAGLLQPTKGTVTTSSRPGLVFQDAATQILGETPREDVAVGPKNARVPKKEIPALVEKSLSAVSLLDKADYAAEFLSGGEKRRLAVAAILAMQRDIIIFDEPYANLDYPGVRDVNALLEQLHHAGKTILLLTHELEKCMALSNQILILQRGKVVFDGTPEQALSSPLEDWGIRNPLAAYRSLSDLVWK